MFSDGIEPGSELDEEPASHGRRRPGRRARGANHPQINFPAQIAHERELECFIPSGAGALPPVWRQGVMEKEPDCEWVFGAISGADAAPVEFAIKRNLR